MSRLLRLVLVTALAVWLVGCATTKSTSAASASSAPSATAESPTAKIDPWENWNRKVYGFNERLDQRVLRPAATTYTKIVPQPVRRGVTNFFGNVSDVWTAFNNILQGKFADGMQDVVRVGTNTLFGVVGIFDVATEMGIDRHNEDLGQTFGRWGMAPGPYLVWPVFGSSTLRDSIALPIDAQISPALAVHSSLGQATVTSLQLVNTRANLLGATNMLNDIALDRYVFTRDAYLQRRRSLVFDGDPPDDEADQSSASEGVAPSADPAASAAKAPAAPASAASNPSS